MTRRSSIRGTPRTLSGSNGRSRSNCSSLNQNSLISMLPQSQSVNHIRAAKGIPFMGPSPSQSTVAIGRAAAPSRPVLQGSGERRVRQHRCREVCFARNNRPLSLSQSIEGLDACTSSPPVSVSRCTLNPSCSTFAQLTTFGLRTPRRTDPITAADAARRPPSLTGQPAARSCRASAHRRNRRSSEARPRPSEAVRSQSHARPRCLRDAKPVPSSTTHD